MPEAEWITSERPDLPIVPADLWARTHARLDATRAIYRRLTDGRIVGRPKMREEGRYLLSSLVECGTCHHGMHATKRTGQRVQPRMYYVCTTHRVRGDVLCANALAAPLPELHDAVATSLAREVLTPDPSDIIEWTMKLRERASGNRSDERKEIEAHLHRLDLELRRYADAIGTMGPPASIVDAVRTREQKRDDLRGRLARLDAARRQPVRALSARQLRDAINARIDDWLGLLERHPVEARQTVLRPMLASRIVMAEGDRGREVLRVRRPAAIRQSQGAPRPAVILGS